MPNILINIWLTLLGPVMLGFTSIGAAYVALKNPYVTMGEFIGMAVVAIIWALSAWGLWNRIWN